MTGILAIIEEENKVPSLDGFILGSNVPKLDDAESDKFVAAFWGDVERAGESKNVRSKVTH